MKAFFGLVIVLMSMIGACDKFTTGEAPERVGLEQSLPESCSTAYPDFCIGVTAAVSCEEVGSHFEVLDPDPHGFDPDGDGIGCEHQP